jgi:hypothetical protein
MPRLEDKEFLGSEPVDGALDFINTSQDILFRTCMRNDRAVEPYARGWNEEQKHESLVRAESRGAG